MDPVEREKLVGRTLMDIGKSFTESACAWIWPAQRSIDLVREVEGLDVLKDALASGKGVVGITSHLGNWEVLNHFYCSQCKPIIFYRPPKLKAVDELLQQQRVQMGNRVAPSTKEGILSVIKEVRRGGQVGIPADPEPAESAGVFVPFLGTQALTSKFVPNMLAGGKAVGVFLHALRLPDGSGYKVILEAAPEAPAREAPALERTTHLLALSARHEGELAELARLDLVGEVKRAIGEMLESGNTTLEAVAQRIIEGRLLGFDTE